MKFYLVSYRHQNTPNKVKVCFFSIRYSLLPSSSLWQWLSPKEAAAAVVAEAAVEAAAAAAAEKVVKVDMEAEKVDMEVADSSPPLILRKKPKFILK